MNARLTIAQGEIEWHAVRSQGAGGQNVNKVASAVHLRFDVPASSLPAAVKARLLARGDRRLTDDGVLVIKSQQHRTLVRNREAALARLADWIAEGAKVPKVRRKTRPSRAAKRRRLDDKRQRGTVKARRGRVLED